MVTAKQCLSNRRPFIGIICALSFTFALIGCAAGPGNRQTNESRLAWVTYFNGLDLRAECRTDGPDRLRLVFHERDDETYTVFEMLRLIRANRAFSTKSVISLDDLSQNPPWNLIGDSEADARNFLEISLRHFAVILYWLDRRGVFQDTESGLVLRSIGSFEWIASGCLRGGWFSSFQAAQMTQRIAGPHHRPQVPPLRP